MFKAIHKFGFREVRDEDLTAICGFPQNKRELYWMFPSADFPLTVGQLRDSIEERSDSMVVTVGGEVAGFANFIKARPNKFCTIGNFVVSGRFRRRGVATFLLSEMERLAAAKYGAKEMGAACFNKNIPAIELYTKMGYTPYDIERRTSKDDEPTLLIRLKKRLP